MSTPPAQRPPFAVVTGAASGIGAATLALLSERGWRVAGIDSDGERLRAVVHGLGLSPDTVFVADVADEAQVVTAFQAIEASHGAIDALVTSAGVVDTTPFMDLGVDTFRRMFDVNVTGTWLCMREAALRMPRGARICTVASVAGIRGGGLSGTAAYAASKGAVLALTKNAARALGERGISVNTVAPGATDTPMIEGPLGVPGNRERLASLCVQARIADPRDIARTIVFLLSPDAAVITGATLVADGGLLMY